MLRSLIVAFVVMSIGIEAGAQQPGVVPGDRVKIRPSPAQSDGVLIVAAVDSQSLTVIGARSRREFVVPLQSIRTLQRSAGRPSPGSSIGRGALSGFVGGAAVGALFGYVLAEDPDKAEAATILGLILGTAGAAAGAVVGAIARPEQWENVPLAPRLVVVPARRGAAVGFSLTF